MEKQYKTPAYTRRACLNWAKRNKTYINACRKKKYFFNKVRLVLENDEIDTEDKIDILMKIHNYDLYKDDEEFIELIKDC
jgi:hypothetical protein